MFRSPMINLYSRDLGRAQSFYQSLGFQETFRTPVDGPPIHVEWRRYEFHLGIATIVSARADHGLTPHGEGRWIEIVLWTDDVDRAVGTLVAAGSPLISPPHDFLDGRLRMAWVSDPEGNPIQIVQRRAATTGKTALD